MEFNPQDVKMCPSTSLSLSVSSELKSELTPTGRVAKAHNGAALAAGKRQKIKISRTKS